jgi:hypothetical protein
VSDSAIDTLTLACRGVAVNPYFVEILGGFTLPVTVYWVKYSKWSKHGPVWVAWSTVGHD